jgi:hypothetical protein
LKQLQSLVSGSRCHCFGAKDHLSKTTFPKRSVPPASVELLCRTSCEKIGLILGLYVALGLNEAGDTFKFALIRNQVKYETFPDSMEHLDRQGDCHFFSDENPASNKGPMDWSDNGLNQMITTLNDHEMSFVLDNKANSFYGMHVEYLFQCLHTTKIQSSVLMLAMIGGR